MIRFPILRAGFAVGATAACLLLTDVGTASALPSPERSLTKCQDAVQRGSTQFINRRIRYVAGCLRQAAVQVIGKNREDAARAAKRCASRFRRIENLGDPTASLAGRYAADIAKSCTPNPAEGVTHTVADIAGTGAGVAEPIWTERLGAYCAAYGGDGTVDDLDKWVSCLTEAAQCKADQAIGLQYPRALEWLAEIRPGVEAASADALAVLDALDLALDTDRDGSIDIKCGPDGPQFFPATGQLISYPADKNGAPGSAVADDGAVRAGASFRLYDNGDGTISDFNTGLMWEKKSDDGGLHDEDNFYPWSDAVSDTIWDWLDQVNAEGGTGFAGHSDWRIPNAKELMSIVDYNRSEPSVDPIFENNCVPDCTVTECSCIASASYWSSTSLRSLPAHAWHVSFAFGYVAEVDRTTEYFVRAVRDLGD